MTKTRSGKTTAVKAPSVSSKKNKSTEAETQEDPELMKLRLAALEQALLDKKSKSKKQVTVSSSSSASDSSDSSTSSSSSSDSEREGRRKSSKRKKHQKAVRSSRATGSRSWSHQTYQHQHEVNRKALRCMSKASKAKSSSDRKHYLKKGKQLLESRQEWLCVADRYGSGAATRYEEGGEWADMFGETEKRRRLMAAIQPSQGPAQSSVSASKKLSSVPAAVQPQLPFRHQTPGSGSTWGGQKPLSHAQGFSSGSPQLQPKSSGACHRCGEIGHYIKFCPKAPQTPASR